MRTTKPVPTVEDLIIREVVKKSVTKEDIDKIVDKLRPQVVESLIKTLEYEIKNMEWVDSPGWCKLNQDLQSQMVSIFREKLGLPPAKEKKKKNSA